MNHRETVNEYEFWFAAGSPEKLINWFTLQYVARNCSFRRLYCICAYTRSVLLFENADGDRVAEDARYQLMLTTILRIGITSKPAPYTLPLYNTTSGERIGAMGVGVRPAVVSTDVPCDIA